MRELQSKITTMGEREASLVREASRAKLMSEQQLQVEREEVTRLQIKVKTLSVGSHTIETAGASPAVGVHEQTSGPGGVNDGSFEAAEEEQPEEEAAQEAAEEKAAEEAAEEQTAKEAAEEEAAEEEAAEEAAEEEAAEEVRHVNELAVPVPPHKHGRPHLMKSAPGMSVGARSATQAPNGESGGRRLFAGENVFRVNSASGASGYLLGMDGHRDAEVPVWNEGTVYGGNKASGDTRSSHLWVVIKGGEHDGRLLYIIGKGLAHNMHLGWLTKNGGKPSRDGSTGSGVGLGDTGAAAGAACRAGKRSAGGAEGRAEGPSGSGQGADVAVGGQGWVCMSCNMNNAPSSATCQGMVRIAGAEKQCCTLHAHGLEPGGRKRAAPSKWSPPPPKPEPRRGTAPLEQVSDGLLSSTAFEEAVALEVEEIGVDELMEISSPNFHPSSSPGRSPSSSVLRSRSPTRGSASPLPRRPAAGPSRARRSILVSSQSQGAESSTELEWHATASQGLLAPPKAASEEDIDMLVQLETMLPGKGTGRVSRNASYDCVWSQCLDARGVSWINRTGWQNSGECIPAKDADEFARLKEAAARVDGSAEAREDAANALKKFEVTAATKLQSTMRKRWYVALGKVRHGRAPLI